MTAAADDNCQLVESIRYDPTAGTLRVLDQLLLPTEIRYIDVNTVEDGWSVIHNMQVC